MTTRHRKMTTTGSTEQPAAFSDGVPNKKDVRCAWSDSVVRTTSLPRHTTASESQIPSLYSDPTCGAGVIPIMRRTHGESPPSQASAASSWKLKTTRWVSTTSCMA